MAVSQNLCILGIGNTLRSDDGIGHYICQLIEKWNLPDTVARTTHQLQAEWAIELSTYSHIILVDAGMHQEPVLFSRLDTESETTANLSHSVAPALLSSLMQTLYGSQGSVYLLSVRGVNFELGERLSDEVMTNAELALNMLKEWLQLHGFMNAPDA